MVTQIPTPSPPLPAPDLGHLAVERFRSHEHAPALLFAHGFGQTRAAWARAATHLAAQGFAGTSFDARGHGESQWNAAEQTYSIEQFVDDLSHLAGAHAAPPVLVGASMGGLLGMYAQGHRTPPPFSALVLVDITPRWEATGVERILGFMSAHPQGFESLEHAADEIAAYLPHRARKSSDDLGKILVQRPDGRWRWHWDPRLIETIGRNGEQHQSLLMEAAQSIDIPTLLISGGRSDLVNDEHIAEFLGLVPHARHIRLPEATHMVVGDDNDAFTRTILDFLVTLPAGNAPSAGEQP